MAELLLELFSEEIPARMQERAGQDLARIVGELLAGELSSVDRAALPAIAAVGGMMRRSLA